MNFGFQNLLGAPYRGGNVVICNNTLLISPVGNRVSITDLVKSQTTTLPFQSSSNITRIAVSPDGAFLLAVDDRNRCLFVNIRRRAVLHRISFKHRVAAVKFSPDGSVIAVAAGKLVQIWRSPGFSREYFPFELVQTFADFASEIKAFDWSPDSNYLLVGSKDLTARILYLKKLRGDVKYRPFLFLGHRDSVIGSFFGVNAKTNKVCKAYTVTRDGYLFSWGFTADNEGLSVIDKDERSEPPTPDTPERDEEGNLKSGGDVDVKKRKNLQGNLVSGGDVGVKKGKKLEGNLESGGGDDVKKRKKLEGNLESGGAVDVKKGKGSEPPSPDTPEKDEEGNLKSGGDVDVKKRENLQGNVESGGDVDVKKGKKLERNLESGGNVDVKKRKGGGDVDMKKRKKLENEDGGLVDEEGYLCRGKWELLRKDGFMQAPAKVTACDYHRALDMVVVSFSSGVFGLYQMPEFVCIHLLSISREKITTSLFNELGNWLTFGCAKLGQLLVWEWRTESYILKQQGHYFDVNCVAYSPDSQLVATGADDNKVKVWTLSSGFCFVTFSEHSNAVTALHFVARKNCLLSASLDGTIRAWDLLRYRNFRTFTPPFSRQFVSLAADQSGEVICAGTSDSFEIFVWRMETGKLLGQLDGHKGPVHGLIFSPTNGILASSSWDKTVRLWDLFGREGAVETLTHTHDVLTVVYRPDGRQLACSTIDGQIHFWDVIDGLLMFTIEGSRDIAGGRLMTDRRSAANSTQGKYFTTLCYSADGSYILAGGSSRYICMYDVADQVLLRRFQITHNLSLDGVLDFLNSKNMTEAGPLDLIDDDNSDIEEGGDKQTRSNLGLDLPGALPNRGRPVIQTKCLKIAPTGRNFVAATTEGVLVYSVDESFIFDPADLDIDVTPEAVDEALCENQPSRALILGLRLNEDSIIKRCIFAVSPADIPALVTTIPYRYLQRLIEALADLLENCPHLEFILKWCQELCKSHGNFIQQNSRNLLPSLKSLQKAITRIHMDLADTCSSNEYMLKYLCSSGYRK